MAQSKYEMCDCIANAQLQEDLRREELVQDLLALSEDEYKKHVEEEREAPTDDSNLVSFAQMQHDLIEAKAFNRRYYSDLSIDHFFKAFSK